MKSFHLVLAVLALGLGALGAVKDCGGARYESTLYVCYDNNFLCPIIAGEAFSYCSGACFSKYMYMCRNGTGLEALPRETRPFSLVVINPTLPAIHNRPVSACGLRLWVAGNTCSYCPPDVPAGSCPPGKITALFPGSSLAVAVPGGQTYFLDQYSNLCYTPAGSTFIPVGSTVGTLVAFQQGGFVNYNRGAWGWVACPPRSPAGSGNNGRWNLVSRNATNAPNLKDCPPVNLKVMPLPEGQTAVAWQYQ